MFSWLRKKKKQRSYGQLLREYRDTYQKLQDITFAIVELVKDDVKIENTQFGLFQEKLEFAYGSLLGVFRVIQDELIASKVKKKIAEAKAEQEALSNG